MSEKPILFSAPMVRAILDGRKTQTRRILKPQPPAEYSLLGIYAPHLTAVWHCEPTGTKDKSARLPYAPGDVLWVREAFRTHEGGTIRDPGSGFVIDHIDPEIVYKADRTTPGGRWKPSIHMPRWASRITLRVTAVKVERLQDISEDDAKAEGILVGEPLPEIPESIGDIYHNGVTDPMDGWTRDPGQAFHDLWTSINGADSWAANPWVAAISFERVK